MEGKHGSFRHRLEMLIMLVMAGRPKRPKDESKSHMMRIRMTPEERALMEQAAKSKSLETSTWARSELVSLAKRTLGKK